jgi:hypothetical protein
MGVPNGQISAFKLSSRLPRQMSQDRKSELSGTWGWCILSSGWALTGSNDLKQGMRTHPRDGSPRLPVVYILDEFAHPAADKFPCGRAAS